MSSLSGRSCRKLFDGSRIARFATVTPAGAPHLVPVTCALGTLEGRDVIVFAVDHKPKSTTALRRLANIAAEPRASFLVDAYSEDWSTLWWVRADVTAAVIDLNDLSNPNDSATVPATFAGSGSEIRAGRTSEAETHGAAIDLLVDKYPQYRVQRPTGAVVLGRVTRWSGWSAGTADLGVD